MQIRTGLASEQPFSTSSLTAFYRVPVFMQRFGQQWNSLAEGVGSLERSSSARQCKERPFAGIGAGRLRRSGRFDLQRRLSLGFRLRS